MSSFEPHSSHPQDNQDQSFSSLHLSSIDIDDLCEDMQLLCSSTIFDRISEIYAPKATSLDIEEKDLDDLFVSKIYQFIKHYSEESQTTSGKLEATLSGPFRTKSNGVISFVQLYDPITNEFILPELKLFSPQVYQSGLDDCREVERFDGNHEGVVIIHEINSYRGTIEGEASVLFSEPSIAQALRNLLSSKLPATEETQYSYLEDLIQRTITERYIRKFALNPATSDWIISDIREHINLMQQDNFYKLISVDCHLHNKSLVLASYVKVPDYLNNSETSLVECVYYSLAYDKLISINLREVACELIGREQDIFLNRE